jgi:membrane-associated phospholipid phosphatase
MAHDHDATRLARARISRWRFICLGSLTALVLLAVAAAGAHVLPGDVEVREDLIEGTSARLYEIALWANYAGSWHGLLPAFVLLMVVSRAARHHWWLWAAVPVAAAFFEFCIKWLVDRPRPNSAFPGFPSGHLTAVTAFAVITFYLAERGGVSRGGRIAILGALAGLVGLVGLARINLLAHWPSDLVGGALLGSACAGAAAWWHSVQVPLGQGEPAGRRLASAGGSR